jgi:multiple sugar transport system permease protein
MRTINRRNVSGYFFLIPTLVVMTVFVFFPLAYALFISFYRWDMSSPPIFVGMHNYVNALQSKQFWDSMLYTLYYVVGVLPFSLIFGLFFAFLLKDKEMKGANIYRMIYFMPVVTSPIAAAMGFNWIFENQMGIANHLLEKMGFQGVDWFTNPTGIVQMLFDKFGINLPVFLKGPSLALVVIILVGIWQNIGYATVVYLAGLQSISDSYYEAASLDGANKYEKFWYITVPLLSPSTFFLLIMFTISSFQVFGPVQIMTPSGGPLNTTSVVVFYIYRQAFSYYNMGYAIAVAFLLMGVILLATLFQFKFLERRVNYE